jgi:putative transposase
MKQQLQQITDLLVQILPEDLPTELNQIHRRRLEIVIRTHLGQSQAEICSALGCSKDTARHWMTIAKTEGLSHWYNSSLGRPKRVNEEYMQRLRELVNSNPKDHGYSFSRWTAGWLNRHLAKELGIEISDRHVNRLLKQMGLSTRQSDREESLENPNPVIKGQTITIEDLNPSLISKIIS